MVMGNNKLEIITKGNVRWVGWTSRVGRRKTSFVVTIDKMIAYGVGIKQGELLHCYLDENEEHRPIMTVYLDGSPRKFEGKKILVNQNERNE